MSNVRRVAEPLRVVRRPRRGGLTSTATRPASLTAAFQPVTDPQQVLKTSLGDKRLKWQDEAWGFYDQVGEFRYYVGWRAGSCSRVTLVASEIDPDSGLPTRSVDDADPAAVRFSRIVAAIAGGPLGQSQMVRRLVEVLSVPGEVWLAILVTDTGERWVPLAREEISRGAGGRVSISLPDGQVHEFDPARGDGLVRIWNPHPRRAGEPDSPVRACLDSLREIVATTATIANAARSRLIGNGVLFIPQETSLPAGPPVEGVGAPAATQQLQDLLVDVASQAVEDPNSMAALVPIVASAPGEWIGKINHLRIDNSVTDVAIATRRDAVGRLATGLDVSPERLTGGLGQANHWSMWGLTDQDVQLHIAPVMETVCQAIYDGVLRPLLAAEGIDPDRFVLWFDTSRLTADPDKSDEAKSAFDAGAITSRALVRHYGLAEDDLYDFTTTEGLQLWAQDKVSRDPALLPTLLPLLDSQVQSAVPEPAPAPELPAPDSTPVADGPGSGAQQQQEPATEGAGARSAAVVAAASPQPVAVEAAVTEMWAVRALELAGKRRVNTRDREQHARLRDIPAHRYHRVLGAVAHAEVPKLIRGWDDTLDDVTLSGIGIDPERLRSQVWASVARELTSPVIDGQVL